MASKAVVGAVVLGAGVLAVLLLSEKKASAASSGGVGVPGVDETPPWQTFGPDGSNLNYPSLPPGVVYFDSQSQPLPNAFQDARSMLALWDGTTVPGISAPKPTGFGSAANPSDLHVGVTDPRFEQELNYFVIQSMKLSGSSVLTPKVLDHLFAVAKAIVASLQTPKPAAS